MKLSLRSLIIAAEFAVIIAVFSQITIPLSLIPLTGQTFAVGLAATILPKKEAFYATIIYLLLGIIGLPVFAGMTSGIGIVLGPTGGFLVGFILNSFITSWLLEKTAYTSFWAVMANIAGALATLLIGTIWLKFFAQLSWIEAFNGGFIPFLFPGLIKALLAAYIGLLIRKRLKKFLLS